MPAGPPGKINPAACLLLVALATSLAACNFQSPAHKNSRPGQLTTLTFTSMSKGPGADFEAQRLNQFAARHKNIRIQHIPAFESDTAQLHLYKQFFHDRSSQPDICAIDVIWPGMIGEDLVDLKPYFLNDLPDYPPELLAAYTVHGRLIAIPSMVDFGMLYYRSDLLRKYGFTNPPATWDDLERMAAMIQRGERRSGNPNFWGYVWQGIDNESLTCNGLEWQASQGGGHILEPNGTVSVCNPNALRALERAVSWIGTISPPSVTAYSEDDSLNVYLAGNAAFLRQWSSAYPLVKEHLPAIATGVALLPGGKSGRSGTMGGSALGVSRFSEHREEAIAAVRDLLSAHAQATRAVQIGTSPTRLSVAAQQRLGRNSSSQGRLPSGRDLIGLTARPSVAAGHFYDQVSRAYYVAVHSALTRQVPPATALSSLQTELVQITAKAKP